MSTIEVAVAGRGIQVKQGYEKPSAGDVNTCAVSLAIESGGVWDSLPHKRVTFATRTASVTVDYAPTIAIPHEVMASPGALYLTLTGYDADGIEVARTHRMTYPIEVAKAGADEGAEPSPATLDVVSRIDALAADLEEKRDTDYWRGEPGSPGEPGKDGAPGAPGYSPTASVTKVGGTATITVTDKNGTTTATVSDGAPGKNGSDATATDVRINGTSITTDGVADIPIASNTNIGLVKLWEYGGLVYGGAGLETVPASEDTISARNGSHYLIPADSRLDYAVKAAMCDGKGAAWTDNEQQAARERMNAADANKVYIMQKQIANLQGIAATEETDSTEAYTKTVPTGAQKLASLDRVGGKTVVWNQLVDIADFSTTVVNGVSFTANSDGSITINGTPISGDATLFIRNDAPSRINYISNHYYAYLRGAGNSGVEFIASNSYWRATNQVCSVDKWDASWGIGNQMYGFSVADGTTVNNETFYPRIIDLTQMFGAGNEPTDISDPRIDMIRRIAEARPEYNPGELMSAEVVEVESKGTFPIPAEVREMCPGYGWSAGTVCNEIDFGRKVYVQRVGSVDLGTLSYWNGSTDVSGKYRFGSDNVKDIKPITQNVVTKDLRYSANTYNYVDGIEVSTQGAIYICDSRYEMAADFKAAMAGVLLYYELTNPVEVDLSNVLPDDHFIEVEAGGTVTFKQASTQLPVPSSVTYQISTSEVIANA